MLSTAILLATVFATQPAPAAMRGSHEAWNAMAEAQMRGAAARASKEQQEDWKARRDLTFRKELMNRLERELAATNEKLDWSKRGRFLPGGASPDNKAQPFPRLKKAHGKEYYEFQTKIEMEQAGNLPAGHPSSCRRGWRNSAQCRTIRLLPRKNGGRSASQAHPHPSPLPAGEGTDFLNPEP